MKKLKAAIASLHLPKGEENIVETKCQELFGHHLLDWILMQLSFEDQKTWTLLAANKRNDDDARAFLASHIPDFAKRSKEELRRYGEELAAHILGVSHGSRR